MRCSDRKYLLAAIAAAASLSTACPTKPHVPHEHKHGHTAAHGGCLSEIEACRVGHVEFMREGETLTLWFVGGDADTDRAVRVPDQKIVLTVTADGVDTERQLTFVARPIELAGETTGDCSRFVASAPWLANAPSFEARGTVTFKGKRRTLKIAYPPGHHSGHDDRSHHEHQREQEQHDEDAHGH